MFKSSVSRFAPIVASRAFSTASARLVARAMPKMAVSHSQALVRPAFKQPIQMHRFYSAITKDEPAKKYDFEEISAVVSKPHEDVVIVDVREPDEYKEGHIPSAVNIPVKSSPGALGLEEEEFLDTFGFEKPSTEKQLVFYCLAGVRSTAAEELACTFGYQK